MPTQKNTFAARLRELRQEANLPVAELARRALVTRQAVYRWEAGERSPSFADVQRLAAALSVGVAAFE